MLIIAISTISIIFICWKLGILLKLRALGFGKFLVYYATRSKSELHDQKTKLFKDLHTLAEKSTKPLKVLEIGPGAGPNFDYLPKGCDMTCYEPNKHLNESLKKNAEKYLAPVSLKIVNQKATDLENFDDNTFDAIITSLVLCSVDTMLLLKGIKRVLKPGGKLYFAEHVQAKDGSWLLLIQKFVNPVWSMTFGGCQLINTIGQMIDDAGFDSVKYDHVRVEFPILWVLRDCIFGTATK